MAEPKIRFKKDDGSYFPEWENIPMSDIFTEISEKNHPEMQVLSVQQGVGTVFRDSSDRNISYDKSNLKNYKAMKKDDFIIHLRSFEGGLECSNYDGISSPAYRILRSKAILPEAYRDYFRSHEFIHNKLAVSVVGIRDGKNIDMDTFWQIPIPVPCLEEQQKIADFLSSVDEVIAASEEEVANLETQKKAVMKKIFSQEVRFKRKDGTDFPEWEEDYVGNRCKIQTGKSNTQDAIEDGEYPFYVRSPLIYRSKRYLFDTEAVITVGDGVGTGKVYHYVNGKFDLHQRAYALTDFIGVTGKYFYCYFSANFYERVRAMTAKTSVDSVRYDMIDKMKIKIPCIEEQYLIANFLSDFDEAIAAAKKELELWKQLKKGLLQQMFV